MKNLCSMKHKLNYMKFIHGIIKAVNYKIEDTPEFKQKFAIARKNDIHLKDKRMFLFILYSYVNECFFLCVDGQLIKMCDNITTTKMYAHHTDKWIVLFNKTKYSHTDVYVNLRGSNFLVKTKCTKRKQPRDWKLIQKFSKLIIRKTYLIMKLCKLII